MARFIVAMCIMNEEQFIENTITSLLKAVKDVDVIEILDGGWKHGIESTKSTDRTKEIIQDLTTKYHNVVDIVFRESERVYENEADKRNTQLEQIQELYGYEPYWVMILDGDEEIKFTVGLLHIWMKDYLGNLPFIGMVKAYAVNSNKPMWNPRFFPGGKGIHYHNNRSMIVHDGSHTIEIDYNLYNQQKLDEEIPKMQVFADMPLFFLNYWPIREKERMKQKYDYCKFQEEWEVVENKPCTYKQPLSQLVTDE